MAGFGFVTDDEEVMDSSVLQSNVNYAVLFQWQKRAIDYFFESGGNCIFEVTTGSGKTICGIKIIKKVLERHPEYRVLIVVPKNVILETGWYPELYDQGISLKDIGVFYGGLKEESKITITNMQNLLKIDQEKYDMIIVDELHNFASNRLSDYLDGDVEGMMFKAKPFKYKLGLTATLDYEKHKRLIKLFGYNIFKYTPEEASFDGILNPFTFMNISVVMDNERSEQYLRLTNSINLVIQVGGGYGKIMRGSSGEKLKLLSLLNDRKKLVNNYEKKFGVVFKIVQKHKDDKVIIFNQYNEQTNKLYWYLLESGVKARIFHSDLPKSERDQNLLDYKNDKFNVLLTTKALDEGYNLPSIDCGIVMSGESTPRQIIQRLGRVLRRKNKPSSIYQVYCASTIEEDNATEHFSLFKHLATNFGYLFVQDGDDSYTIPEL